MPNMNKEDKMIGLPSEIYDLIKEKIRDPLTGFETVDDYVKFVLEKALGTDTSSEQSTSEDERVEEKLKQLGYI